MGAQDQKPKDRIVKMRITSCSIGYAGKNTRGDDYQIYEITAEKGEGEPINQKLRSFSPLPIGQVIEVTVKRFDSDNYGTSYTLTPKHGAGGPHSAAINEHSEKIADLIARVTKLENLQSPE